METETETIVMFAGAGGCTVTVVFTGNGAVGWTEDSLEVSPAEVGKGVIPVSSSVLIPVGPTVVVLPRAGNGGRFEAGAVPVGPNCEVPFAGKGAVGSTDEQTLRT